MRNVRHGRAWNCPMPSQNLTGNQVPLPLKGRGPGWGSRPKLTARVGIDSGAVVVSAGAGKEADVFGEAPNIAARVQAAAEAGTVLITDAVDRLDQIS